ncbi:MULTISPECIES: hypothetical protein [Streptomyces]|uniref:hypothetical protein n=1 Tax=Streptomyces TaxID=1883 RepID=UPI000A9F75BC|nr:MULTISPECIES: hypothetical protein [Streptomyces]MBD3547942.1 hypothetical protein [Streptomyces sp. JV180]
MRKGIATVLVTAVGAAVLAGCGLKDLREESDGAGGGTDPGSAASDTFTPKAPVPRGKPLDGGSRLPAAPKPDDGDPTSVARTWATVAYGYDTAYDQGRQDAVLRTLPFLTTARASAEREHVSAGGTGGDWNVWAGHRAWTTVRLTFEDGDDDLPPDTPVLAYREIFVEGTAHGRDGWTGPGPRLMASVKLTRTVGGPWRVADVRVVEEALPPAAARPSAPASPSVTPPVRKN